MLLENKKVVVIGARPVGLTFAKLLQKSNVNVSMYEWDKNEIQKLKVVLLIFTMTFGK